MSILDNQRITDLRKTKGWEQRDLAHAAKVNPSVISRLERGLQEDFKLSVIFAIASALDVTVDDLLTPSKRHSTPQITSSLQAAVNRLSKHSPPTQNRVAGAIVGYLSVLEKENDNGS